ncbi:MAG: amino acid-binding protein [Desulfovibrio sp.]|nr:amino acid-binding protein [Desulfovibrio sp.]
MTVSQISVFIENKAGKMAEFAHVLQGHGIDMKALSVAEGEKYGIARIIVDDVYNTSTVLKDAGYVFKITPVLAVPLRDSSGGLAEVLEVLGNNDINVEYLYAFVARQQDKAYVIFRVANNEHAIQVLCENGYTPVSQDELKLDK